MARFLGWVDGESEPITLAQVVVQARLDEDQDDLDYIESVVIPAARQAAEARTGSAIRKGRYRDTLTSVPRGGFPLDMGAAYEVTSITVDGTLVSATSYDLVEVDKDRQVLPLTPWPTGRRIVVEYLAGVDIAGFPGAAQWMLLAATWLIEQPSMFTVGEAVEAVPGGFVDSLLWPLTVPPRV